MTKVGEKTYRKTFSCRVLDYITIDNTPQATGAKLRGGKYGNSGSSRHNETFQTIQRY